MSQAEAHVGEMWHSISSEQKHPVQQLPLKQLSDNPPQQTLRPPAQIQQSKRVEQTAKTSVHSHIITKVNCGFIFGMFLLVLWSLGCTSNLSERSNHVILLRNSSAQKSQQSQSVQHSNVHRRTCPVLTLVARLSAASQH